MYGRGSLELSDLSQGERLLLRAVRRQALESPCHSLRLEFEAACGAAGPEACRALMAFVEQLRWKGRRRIAIAPPCASGVSGDEALLLTVFASAQADDYRSLDEGLEALMGAEPPASLGAAACLVGQLFAMHGLVLQVRDPVRSEQGPSRPRLCAVVAHA
ncbi:hypothetical protein [Phenylobacterium deserti]|uniref:Uncharacterized protein n=1 Tax=Phenylobacterium deserti TaxID=1914756 RepID=A0A328AQW3_9CAUL|nr:hypothetical protein [Phenylobacterium deserti]RAK57017.1 hypothetical protein DJ018_03390 [Phenylobacterium deserti]